MSTTRHLEQIKEWNRTHSERRREINKKYRETHKDELAMKQREYYNRWKEKKLAQQQTIQINQLKAN